jgi:peptide-methionine (S)-S-oxide reductase|tara:strand:- start:248 stop:823 length:576 start_codon:yes stop_codon:yes gene_type:complete
MVNSTQIESVDVLTEGMEEAVLGGGCFWCTESVLSALRGVKSVTPGYAGGDLPNPTYEAVCEKNTGHIEVVRVVFDPAEISYETLLTVFFATHDPTTVNRQGNDVGPQYASVIFYHSDEQERIAGRVMREVENELGQAVVTQLRPKATFWPAEEVHHDYYARNPMQGYCVFVISPKLSKLRSHFGNLLATK